MKSINYITKVTTCTAIIASIAFAPALSLAKENEDKKTDNRQKKEERVEVKTQVKILKENTKTEEKKNKEEKKEEKVSSLKAFGHLIAPGWIKLNGEATTTSTSTLPFGIAKKLSNFFSRTPDTTAPIISAVVAAPKANEAMITWQTNEKSDSSVYLSDSSSFAVSTTSIPAIEKKRTTRTHKLVLTNLASNKVYYAVVRSRDAAHNVSFSNTISFTTTNEGIADTTLPVISNIVAITGTSTVKVLWKTNEMATSKVFFSTVNPVSATSTAMENISLTKEHSMNLTNLIPNTAYYMFVQSKDTSGNTQSSGQFSLTTGI